MDKKNLPQIPLAYYNKKSHLIDALQYLLAIKEQTNREKSFKTYRSIINRFKMWLHECRLEKITIKEFKPVMAHHFSDEIKLNSLSGYTVNKYISIMAVFFNEIVRRGWMKENPFDAVTRVSVSKDVPKALTEPVLFDVLSLMKERDVPLYRFALCIYYLFIRSAELMSVRVSDLDLKKQILVLRREVTKTKKDRFLRLPDILVKMFIDMGIDRRKKSDFVFGARLEYYSQTPIPRSDYISKRWKRLRESFGFQDSIKIYNLKHTGIQDHINAGIPLTQIQRQSGLTLAILQVYAESAWFSADDIFVDKSPVVPTENPYRRSPVDRMFYKIEEMSLEEQDKLRHKLGWAA